MNFYRRLCIGVKDKGKLIPVKDSPTSHGAKLGDQFKDVYTSIYKYNEEQYQKFQTTGTVSGITDTVTERLVWDFDDKEHPELAQKDAIVLCDRLIKNSILEDAVRIFFSGNKGIHVQVNFNEDFTVSEFKAITKQLASGLETYDSVVNDPQRLFRYPGSVHITSGLFKIPLTLEELKNLSLTEIKEKAKSWDNLDTTPFAEWKISLFPSELKELKKFKEETKQVVKVMEDLDKIDWTKKIIPSIPNCRHAISLGLFNEGERNNALMAYCAWLKNAGFTKRKAYFELKSSAEEQSLRTGQEKYSKKEIWKTIIEEVYGPNWKNGQYTCSKPGWLQDFCNSLGHNKCSHKTEVLVDIPRVYDLFKDYSEQYENNILQTGIPDLDNKMKFMVGTSAGILAPPGVGKCLGKGTPVLMFDGSIKKVEDVVSGDLLMGDDSTPRTVLSTCRGNEPLYRVEQTYGNDYVVNESHILSLKCGATFSDKKRNKKFTYGKLNDIEVKDYFKESKTFRRYYKGYKVGVNFTPQAITLDAYILGYWLGNGTSSKPEFTVHNSHVEVFEKLKDFASSVGLSYSENHNSENSKTVSLVGSKNTKNRFTELLRNLNIFENKHIPKSYLINDRNVRLGLLAGLLDSDGYLDSKKNTYEFSSSDKDFAEQVDGLCKSLGFKSVMYYKNSKYNSFSKGKRYSGQSDSWRLYITGEELNKIPVALTYKKAKAKEQSTDVLLSSLTLIPLGHGDYYGFEIDGNKRFLLGDYTVTHNTSLCLQILEHNSNSDVPCLFYSYDMFHSALYMRMLQRQSGMQQDAIYKAFKENPDSITKHIQALEKNFKNVQFCFKAGQTIDELESSIIEAETKLGRKPKLIVVDYNELVMTGEEEDQTSSTAIVAQRLRQIANVHEVAVITLLQPSKAFCSPADEITNYNSVKGSSSTVQSLTLLLGCSRPGFDPLNSNTDKFFNVTCLKNRNGPLFTQDLSWEGLSGRIESLETKDRAFLNDIRAKKAALKNDKPIW